MQTSVLNVSFQWYQGIHVFFLDFRT